MGPRVCFCGDDFVLQGVQLGRRRFRCASGQVRFAWGQLLSAIALRADGPKGQGPLSGSRRPDDSDNRVDWGAVVRPAVLRDRGRHDRLHQLRGLPRQKPEEPDPLTLQGVPERDDRPLDGLAHLQPPFQNVGVRVPQE